MNAPNPALMIQEIAHRTRINLEFVELNQRKFGAKIYEVTQLLNSTLGLLVFPVELLIDQLFTESPDKVSYSSRIIYSIDINKNNVLKDDYKTMLRMCRHAFAHGNFYLGESGNIKMIRLWNYPNRCPRIEINKNWEIQIKPRELRKLMLWVCDILENDLLSLTPEGVGMKALRDKPDLLNQAAV